VTIFLERKSEKHFRKRRRVRQDLDVSLDAGFLIGLLFNPEDGGDMFVRNVG
jgi:hypothetical protein